MGAAWRWCRRHPAVAGLAATVAAFAVIIAAGSTIAAWKLQAALTTARDAERRKSEQLIDTVLSQADANRLSRRPGQRFETLRLLQAACERADEIGSGGKWDRRVRDLAIAAFCLPDLVADIRWPGRFPQGCAWFDNGRAHDTLNG